MSRVTGEQARALLRNPNGAVSLLQAHDAVETLAWLYGREPNVAMGIHSVEHHNDTDCDLVFALKGGTIMFDTEGGHRTPEEAEEFARAILATVEEVRRG